MPTALTSGACLDTYETLDSTSLEAKRRIENADTECCWIQTAIQTAGYGRRGAPWKQEAGDLAATLIFQPDGPPDKLAQLSFAAGLAVDDAIHRFAPNSKTSLKWPNDVLAGDGKIAGILMELAFAPSGSLFVTFGVGLNIVSAPQKSDYPTARLLDLLTGEAPTPLAVLSVLDETFDYWRDQWSRHGFAPVRSEWLGRAAGRGKPVRVRLPNKEIVGIFVDIDEVGALVLECHDGQRRISAGAIIGF